MSTKLSPEAIGRAVGAALRELSGTAAAPAKPVPDAQVRRLELNVASIKKFLGPTNGKRKFTGIATTPATDLMGDQVVPRGAQFQLPIPLLWQHDARLPIGWVRSARVESDGIHVECEVAEGVGKADEAWQHVEAGLTLGLSIGFVPIKSEPMANGGMRFTAWRWTELSVVTIAANPPSRITSTKGAGSVALLRPGSVQLLKGDKA